MTLVSRIRKLCKEKNLSLFELEEAAGIKHGNIYRWDTSIPGVDKVGLVAKYLGTTVDYLIGNDEDGNTIDQMNKKEAAKLLRLYDELGINEQKDLIWYAEALRTKYHQELIRKYKVPSSGYEPLDPALERIAKNIGVLQEDDE